MFHAIRPPAQPMPLQSRPATRIGQAARMTSPPPQLTRSMAEATHTYDAGGGLKTTLTCKPIQLSDNRITKGRGDKIIVVGTLGGAIQGVETDHVVIQEGQAPRTFRTSDQATRNRDQNIFLNQIDRLKNTSPVAAE